MSVLETGERKQFGPLAPGWRLLMLASLALNLVVAGLVIGSFLTHGPPGRGPGPRDFAFGPYTYALTPEDRRAIFEAMRRQRGDLPPPRELMAAERRELAAALRREPFDPAALRTVLDSQRQRADERFQLGQSLLVERMSALSPAAREAMAARLEQGPNRD